MISRIGLRRWRAYELAEIRFGEGTTFIVAPNGIGKTSLFEAAQFALRGRHEWAVSPVSLGEDSAEVELDLDLPSGDVLSIRRVISANPAVDPTLAVTLNGKKLSEPEFVGELDRGFNAAPDFIARNAFLRDSLRDVEFPNLRSLLARAYDLGGKRAEADQLAALAEELRFQATHLSKELRTEERAVGRLESDLETAKLELTNAGVDLDRTRAQMDVSSTARAEFLAVAAATQRTTEWDADAENALDAARRYVSTATLATLSTVVDEFAGRVEVEVAKLQERVAGLRARIELIESSLGELQEAGADCPVCRRPLGDHDRRSAEAGHRAEVERLRAELATANFDQARRRLDDVRLLVRQVVALGPRPDGPQGPPVPDPHDVFDSARAELERAASLQVEAQGRLRDLEAALILARDIEEGSALSERAWRHWALTKAASDTLLKSIDDVLNNEITPVRRAVARRWDGLFLNRRDLEFDLDGELWRLVNGHRLPLLGFSAGEQTAARLLMQLAILTTATNVDFCWFDEPLENLDPSTRRRVAGLLAQGRKTTGLRQLVVTTYEAELAAQLAQVEDLARVEYVRAGPMDERVD